MAEKPEPRRQPARPVLSQKCRTCEDGKVQASYPDGEDAPAKACADCGGVGEVPTGAGQDIIDFAHKFLPFPEIRQSLHALFQGLSDVSAEHKSMHGEIGPQTVIESPGIVMEPEA